MTDLLQQAIATHKSGDLAGAERLYRAVLDAEPNRADARYNLGLIYGQLGRPFEAVREVSRALETRPEFGQGWFMLAEFADAIGNRELNVFAGEQAARLMPDNGRALLRYGLALSRAGRDEEALEAFRSAAKLDAKLVKAWVNLCVVAKSFGLYDEAEAAIRNAFTAMHQSIVDELGADETEQEADENTYTYLHWHLALLELLKGRYKEGFAHFRARFHGGTDWKRFVSDKPLWRGEDLRGKTILITIEQGFGDALMLARYLHWLKADGARVIFQAHPALAPLFKNWLGADEIVPHDSPVTSTYDFHAAIFDLPHRFGTTLESVPASVPYLPTPEPDEDTNLEWLSGNGHGEIPPPLRGRLGGGSVQQTQNPVLAESTPPLAPPSRGGEQYCPRIGVIWAGQPDNIRGRNRSVPLALFADIFSLRGVEFFSLTRDKREGEAELLRQYPVTDLGPQLTDFAVTARYMNQMDLIITCDTSTAHLAGGMGKKVWTLLPFVPDWRWALERDDNVWYPTMRLFRQSRRDEWGDVVARVRTELDKEQKA